MPLPNWQNLSQFCPDSYPLDRFLAGSHRLKMPLLAPTLDQLRSPWL
ncbi:hypothetical protein AVDCRST_MAG92-3571 [uncultured Coleofasciculus sp.]|uniref:Uncharacterized protein n=1 Tax=uncultured Coleofasciculus sp. TaxID=1267456 RepID=A0A6J4JLB0_9CYAN|nr:hypothetical protein AVDCRST_MAG92-3571 [uncultured Coleofasciculus sp.]